MTTPDQNYHFVGFDFMTTIAYFSWIGNSITQILPITIDSSKPSGFKRTVTGLTASLNLSYVDQQLENFTTKIPPLYAYEIAVSLSDELLPGNFPNPSGRSGFPSNSV